MWFYVCVFLYAFKSCKHSMTFSLTSMKCLAEEENISSQSKYKRKTRYLTFILTERNFSNSNLKEHFINDDINFLLYRPHRHSAFASMEVWKFSSLNIRLYYLKRLQKCHNVLNSRLSIGNFTSLNPCIKNDNVSFYVSNMVFEIMNWM